VGNAGASAYAALVEWENFGRLASLAPGLADRIAVAEASAAALGRYRAALGRLIAADQDPAAGMAGSVRFVDAARARVAPSTWWEALVVAVVWVPLVETLGAVTGTGTGTRTVTGTGAWTERTAEEDPADRDGWAVWRLREAIEADPALGARLALWGRRLGGEAIALAADFARPAPPADQARSPFAGPGQAALFDQPAPVVSFPDLAERVAQAHAVALTPVFGDQENRPGR
jgi:hypothetical protein